MTSIGTCPAALPRIGFGAATLGNLGSVMTDEDAAALVEAAWQEGLRFFDTAPHYGLGLSERRLGAALAHRPRDEYLLSTKVGRLLEPTTGAGAEDPHFVVPADHRRVWAGDGPGVRRSLADSLVRLGTDRVDLALLHDPDEHVAPDELHATVVAAAEELALLRDEGLVRWIGVGSKSVPALLAAVDSGVVDVVMVAGRYTLLDQSALPALLPRCRERRVGVVVAGVFNSGVLATPGPEPGPGATYEYAAVPREVALRRARLAEVCRAEGVELPTAALHLPLLHPAVTSLVLGAREPAHLTDSIRRLAEPIPDTLWQSLVARGLLPVEAVPSSDPGPVG